MSGSKLAIEISKKNVDLILQGKSKRKLKELSKKIKSPSKNKSGESIRTPSTDVALFHQGVHQILKMMSTRDRHVHNFENVDWRP